MWARYYRAGVPRRERRAVPCFAHLNLRHLSSIVCFGNPNAQSNSSAGRSRRARRRRREGVNSTPPCRTTCRDNNSRSKCCHKYSSEAGFVIFTFALVSHSRGGFMETIMVTIPFPRRRKTISLAATSVTVFCCRCRLFCKMVSPSRTKVFPGNLHILMPRSTQKPPL